MRGSECLRNEHVQGISDHHDVIGPVNILVIPIYLRLARRACHAGEFPFRQHGVGATWTGTDGAIRRRLNGTDFSIAERQGTWLKPLFTMV